MKIIVLNHKMNLYYNELDNYINRINKINNPLIIAPSNIYLTEFIKNCQHKISSQDVCYIEDGNYTGKVSWSQIKSLGIKYSLVSHGVKNDNIDKINIKLKVCLSNDITPILCFGNENKEENITNVLSKINLNDINNVIFAYEPLFNISSNNIDINYITKQINIIHTYLQDKYGQKPIVLYGGGINKHNILDIYNIEKLNGILLGSISSDIDEVEQLLLKINEK